MNDVYNKLIRNRYSSVSKTSASIIMFGLVGCLISCIIIMMYGRNDEYFLYFLLPMGYAAFLIITIFAHHAIYNKITFNIFLGLYFLKLVVLPAISAIGGFYIYADGEVVKENIVPAILLSFWEPVFVALALVIYTRCDTLRIKMYSLCNSNYKVRYSGWYDGADVIILAGIMFVVIALLYYPSLSVRFSWIINIGTTQDTVPDVRSWRELFAPNARELPLGLVDTYMMAIFYVVRVLFPLMIIEKIGQKKCGEIKKALLSFLVIILSAQITTATNADTILFATATTILVFKMYPKFRKIYGPIIFIFGLSTVAVLFALKTQGSAAGLLDGLSTMQRLSTILNSYFNGPLNLSIAIKAEEHYGIAMGISEFLGNLPIFNHFFIGNQTSVIFNETYWGFAGRTDQLLSSLGQGYMYFGPIFAPLQQVIIIILAFKIEDFSENLDETKTKGYFLFLAIITICTIGNNLSTIIGYGLRYLSGIIILYFIRYRCVLRSRVRPQSDL